MLLILSPQSLRGALISRLDSYGKHEALPDAAEGGIGKRGVGWGRVRDVPHQQQGAGVARQGTPGGLGEWVVHQGQVATVQKAGCMGGAGVGRGS